ncbi:phosphotransferase [Salinispora arenicola]|uniref:phosphotransferase n=1 Tax=Salinispora arenicola TaxID=168697 RepID=UPI000372F5F5|nr:phosphotransferase [Salinispora arenicola]
MVSATRARIGWADLPSAVCEAVERSLGSPVVTAVSQPHGFSPGTADRVVTMEGQRAFVKAVGRGLNEQSVALHRAEARIAAALPSDVPAPRLLACHDDGEWIVLAFQDVEGRHPSTPWSQGEVSAVFAALADLARVTTAYRLPVPTAVQQCGPDLGGWRHIASDRPPALDPWVAAHLPMLQAAADRALAGLEGQTLVHTDLRTDNLLLRADGTVAVVDWPHACRGPAWLDRVLLCVNLLLHGGIDIDPIVTRLSLDTAAPERLLIDTLVGYTGFFLDAARQPPPPGLPTIRAFQQAQADALLSWVRRRLTSR